MADPLEPIEHATWVNAQPERCYDAFATGEGLDGWFTHGSRVDARPGGTIRLRWVGWGPDGVTAEDGGPVVEAERPRRFAFRWHEGDTLVRLTFEPRDGGTVVRVHESGYPNTPAGRRACLECATGWGEALALAKMWIEHGIATHDPAGHG